MNALVLHIIIVSFIAFSCSSSSERKKAETHTIAEDAGNVPVGQSGEYAIFPFGNGGQVKMLYDRRQRPQSVFIDGKIKIVYNGGAVQGEDGRARTFPFAISFDPQSLSFSSPVKLGGQGSRDHHHCPVIWADNDDYLHVLYGNHSTAGTHIVSNMKANIGSSDEDWSEVPQVRHSLSYPTAYRIFDNKTLVYFRTGEHRSAWTYLISDDNGNTWTEPNNHVVDLNLGGETQPENNKQGIEEWSSYHTCLPSKDGEFLHVVFIYYDDNKKKIPAKFYNPRYKTKRNLNIKYNLYYVKVNLRTHEVQNFDGEMLNTPIDMDDANAKCMIWDTEWRGAGVPPDIILNANENPAFLHVLSEDSPDEFNYYYVRFDDEGWKRTVIAPSNHKWNSNYLKLDEQGILYAYIIVGENNKGAKEGNMDRYGGGNIEEWRSYDQGKSWSKFIDLTPRDPEFAEWKYNNVQPIKDSKGNVQDGMLIFYGWKDREKPAAQAFLAFQKEWVR